jgi:hypothetical protein
MRCALTSLRTQPGLLSSPGSAINTSTIDHDSSVSQQEGLTRLQLTRGV